ncbi:MAG: lytic transglycosylase domain-containing protein [Streptosporangiaceae bacterium]|jgi:hypothetical protein
MAILVGAGALTVTTAVAAAAATLPSTAATASATTSHSVEASAVTNAMELSVSQTDLGLEKARSAAIQRAQEARVAAAEASAAAAAKAAAQQAAARRAHLIYENRQAQAQAAAQAQAQAQTAKAAASSSSSSSSSSSTSTSSSTYSGSPQEIAQEMLSSYGWSSQWSCLDDLWEQESNWSVTAENASSGAYGIAQALPGSKMASAGSDWETSAATQITWGLEYIQSTYGSPCAAWDHEESDGWY